MSKTAGKYWLLNIVANFSLGPFSKKEAQRLLLLYPHYTLTKEV